MADEFSNNQISVSVVMCTYNGAAFVEAQLQTILQQTYPLKEILIFDDVSTDETVAILQRMAEANPLIKLTVNQANLGYTRNFEKAFKAATGDAIAVSDQDDLWVENKIERMVRAWQPGIPLIYSYSYQFESEVPSHPKPHPLFRRFEGTDARKLFMFNTVSGHAMIFRRSFLASVLPLSEEASYDWWMAVIACYKGGVQYVPEVLTFQRKHGNNQTVFDVNRYTLLQMKQRFKDIVSRTCRHFATIPFMPEAHRKMVIRLAQLLEESLNHEFYKPLFWFLVKHRTQLFNHRRRFAPIFTQLKQSYRYSKN